MRRFLSFFARKVAIFIGCILTVTTATFFLMHIAPGDPFSDEDFRVPRETVAALQRHYGLDQPWHVQYWRYLKGLLRGDFGPSYKYQGRQVSTIIAETFPISLVVGIETLCIAVPMGILCGALAAWKHRQWQDRLIMSGATLVLSVPMFLTATLFQYLFTIYFRWFPMVFQFVFATHNYDKPLMSWDLLWCTTLPALSLATSIAARIMRLTRASMLDVLRKDYILTARSRGLSNWQIITRHLLRNSILPVLTYLGPTCAVVLTGTFTVEMIFAVPGLGRWFIDNIRARDYTMIMGTTVFYSIVLMICNLAVDLLSCWVDPRIITGQDKKLPG